MAHYIDIDTLRAKIKTLQNVPMDENRNFRNAYSSYDEGWFDVFTAIDDFINTLEVKEVKEADFCTEVYRYMDEQFNVYDDGNQTLQTKDKNTLIGRVDVENIAKHFFELGLNIQKEK